MWENYTGQVLPSCKASRSLLADNEAARQELESYGGLEL